MIASVLIFKQDFMKTKAFIFIITAGILWGTSPLFVNYLADFGFSSVQLTTLRSIVAVAVLAVYMLIKDRSLFRVRPIELLLFALSGISYVGAATLYYQSLQMTSSSTAVVLMYTAPVYVMIYSVAFLGERLTKLKFFSVAAMLIGCFLVSGIIGGLKFHPVGILLGVLSGITYSAYNIITKIEMRRGANAVSATFYAFVFAAVAAIFVCEPGRMFSKMGENVVVTLPIVIIFGITTCILPYFLYTLSMRSLPAGTASSLAIIEPMAATVFSAVFLNQIPSVFSVIGIILILGAVVILGRTESKDV